MQLDSAGGEACTSGDRPDVFLFWQSGASLRGFLGLSPGVVLSGQMEAHVTRKSALMLQWTRQDAPGRVLGVTCYCYRVWQLKAPRIERCLSTRILWVDYFRDSGGKTPCWVEKNIVAPFENTTGGLGSDSESPLQLPYHLILMARVEPMPSLRGVLISYCLPSSSLLCLKLQISSPSPWWAPPPGCCSKRLP